MTVQFELGCDITEFRQYYESVQVNPPNGLEIRLLKQNPEHLIIWRKDAEIIGHALWHKASTDEHQKGDPRNAEDQAILRELFGGKRDLVELHEVWLKKEHRGKGYGNLFFTFFEDFMREKQHTEIAYYAYHPAALTICRSRGYKEGCCLEDLGFEGKVETTHVFRISL
jgi:GNAT superfamily N-acetyltransferase